MYSVVWALCHWSHGLRPCTCFLLLWENGEQVLLHFIRRHLLSCRNQWRDHSVSSTELCEIWVHSDSFYAGAGKYWESLLYLALIKIKPAPAGSGAGHKNMIWTAHLRELWHQIQNAVPALACLPKNRAHPWPILSLPSGHTIFFLLL